MPCTVCTFCCQLCGDPDLVGRCPNGETCEYERDLKYYAEQERKRDDAVGT